MKKFSNAVKLFKAEAKAYSNVLYEDDKVITNIEEIELQIHLMSILQTLLKT